MSLSADGQWEAALDRFDAALAFFRSSGNRAGEADALRQIGTAHAQLEQYQQALDAYRQSLSLCLELGALDCEARARFNIGNVFWWMGRPSDASGYFDEASTLFREMGAQELEALALENSGDAYWKLEQPDLALSRWREALEAWQSLGAPEPQARVRSSIEAAVLLQAPSLDEQGRDLLQTGEYRGALAKWDAALAAYEELDDVAGQASVMNDRGVAYYRLGRYDEAQISLNGALAAFRRVGDQNGEVSALSNLGTLHLGQGEYQEALKRFTEMLTLCRKCASASGEALALTGQGNAYDLLGQYRQAQQAYESALQLFRETGDRASEGELLNNVGNIHWKLKDYGKALAAYQTSLETAQGTGNRLAQGNALDNIGNVQADLGQSELALETYSQALALQREVGDVLGEAQALNNIGYVLKGDGRYREAARSLEDALALYEQIGDSAGQALVLDNLGQASAGAGNEAVALSYYRLALDIYDAARSAITVDELKTSYSATYQDLCERMVALLIEQGLVGEAFEVAERARARTLLDQLGNRRISPNSQDNPDLVEREADLRQELGALTQALREEWAKPKDTRRQAAVEQLTLQIDAARQEYADLLEQLKLEDPEYGNLMAVSPLTLGQVQALLGDQAAGSTLLAYFVGDTETAVFVVGAETFFGKMLPAGREELRRQVMVLLGEMKAAALVSTGWQAPAEQLYASLVAPVEPLLPRWDSSSPARLEILPHDVLNYLPFGLLSEGERSLVEGYVLSYLPNASALRYLAGSPNLLVSNALVLANPDASGYTRLRYAAAEAQSVADICGVRPWLGPESTEARFKAEAAHYSLIHVAAHADLETTAPLFSAVLLQPGGGEDGRLETHEVLALDLPQTNMVVLSACQTHLAEPSAGDEMVSLERAFLRSGASSLVSTLWQVDDAATAELMRHLYGYLKRGRPKAEALRQAQLKMQAEGWHPYYWAAFMLVGDGGTPNPSKARWPWAMGGAVAVLLFVVLGVRTWRSRGAEREPQVRDEKI